MHAFVECAYLLDEVHEKHFNNDRAAREVHSIPASR